MEQRSSAASLSLEGRIRSLGFNPEHLTPDEQVELLALHASLPVNPREPQPRVEPSAPTPADGPNLAT